jgi:chorismate mutase-like protein
MVARLNWMDEVAQAKQARSLPITDPVREAELLTAMEKRGVKSGLPAHAVRQFFTGQMQAAKHCQQEWLLQNPRAASHQAPPDLARTVRPALDHIGGEMITALAAARRSKEGPDAILIQARHQLHRAGYSPTVTTAALHGLQAALKRPGE